MGAVKRRYREKGGEKAGVAWLVMNTGISGERQGKSSMGVEKGDRTHERDDYSWPLAAASPFVSDSTTASFSATLPRSESRISCARADVASRRG